MRALLIVDIQNDFCPQGALGIANGDKTIPVINSIIDKFSLVLASKDWHPPKTIHFEKWPPHCVRETKGAGFHPDLHTDKIQQVFLKGTGNEDDGYSAFEATNVDLGKYLKDKDVTELFLVGLATDYCVRFTGRDAVSKGFKTFVVTDAVAAVNVKPGNGQAALDELKSIGVQLLRSDELK